MKISIITTIYKGNQYINDLFQLIRRNVEFLKKSSIKVNIEYILVNDSPEVPLDYENSLAVDFELILHNNEHNCGIHQSRVNGLKCASGEFVLFLDQDDSITDNYLFSQLSHLGDADIVIANGYRGGHKKSVIYGSRLIQYFARFYYMYIHATDMILSPGQCLIRKEAIPTVWEDHILHINGCDDFLLWLCMFSDKAKFVINIDKIYLHVDSENNYSNSFEKMHLSYMAMCDILRVGGGIPQRHIDLLQRRQMLKFHWKSAKFTEKLKLIPKNMGTLLFMIFYKTLGYY